jgi:hypothetical protein
MLPASIAALIEEADAAIVAWTKGFASGMGRNESAGYIVRTVDPLCSGSGAETHTFKCSHITALGSSNPFD